MNTRNSRYSGKNKGKRVNRIRRRSTRISNAGFHIFHVIKWSNGLAMHASRTRPFDYPTHSVASQWFSST